MIPWLSSYNSHKFLPSIAGSMGKGSRVKRLVKGSNRFKPPPHVAAQYSPSLSRKKSNTACEGYGVVVRLESPKTSPIKTLVQFINSKEFIGTIAEKFGVNLSDTTYDAGLQKYLDGYEISPHPDIRKKALTYMVNINPSPASFDIEHHTSYLRFKPKWRFVEEFWKGNAELDRCWVPWDWCEIQKQQRNNNSMVIFSPSHDTIHAVKADYDHLPNQRTQLYGNLWFNEHQNNETPNWEEFVITPTPNRGEKRLFSKFLPQRLKWFLEHRKNRGTHGQRNI